MSGPVGLQTTRPDEHAGRRGREGPLYEHALRSRPGQPQHLHQVTISKPKLSYRVCQKFRLLLIYESIFTTFKPSIILEAVGAVLKIGSSVKPNHHREI